ncbi:DUF6264 family protein [Agreia sp.]|uniref:DUF6264 family protein n=1 Tax=Agreia sp. TaxID=1872416 RepID=UPI0035BC1C39
MADDRPTPRYGEIAPEGWVWSPPADPHSAEAGSHAAASVESPQKNARTTATGGASSKPWRTGDAAISVALLVLAVMLTSSTVPSLFGLRSTIDMFYADRGLGEYGGGSAVDIAGAVAAVTQLVLLAGAIWLTVRLVGQRRRSWPVPLLIGALAMIVTFGCVVLALVADPGLLASISAS